MLKMRLQRRGKRNFATYRVVVADQHAPIQGRFIEDVGSYNPHTKKWAVDAERVQRWLSQGVQPSATVHNLLVTHGLLKADKVTIWRPPVGEARPEGGPPQNTAPTTDSSVPTPETAAPETATPAEPAVPSTPANV